VTGWCSSCACRTQRGVAGNIGTARVYDQQAQLAAVLLFSQQVQLCTCHTFSHIRSRRAIIGIACSDVGVVSMSEHAPAQ
jgi:hypothetical protein